MLTLQFSAVHFPMEYTLGMGSVELKLELIAPRGGVQQSTDLFPSTRGPLLMAEQAQKLVA